MLPIGSDHEKSAIPASPPRAQGGAALHVAISGATGLVGSALAGRLLADGQRVTRLVRRPPAVDGEVLWDPASGALGAGGLAGADALVHLAGENIASGRWTGKRKRRLRESRVTATARLCETLARLERPPRTLVAASAAGYYGERGEDELGEDAACGEGFLAKLARDWEAACEPARAAGIRVVSLRIGMVLSARGGALKRMLSPFRLGLGGPLGKGRQRVSWIALDDLLAIMLHVLADEGLHGPINVVAPHSPTGREFAHTLGDVLGRPARLTVPAPLLRLALGEMAGPLLLASTRVRPRRLEEVGFRWRHPRLDSAIRSALECAGRSGSSPG